MKPMNLRLENFRSFRKARDLDFQGLGIFAIIGDTGIGKTSILEAMTYALFNRSTWHGGAVKELIAKGASAMAVKFVFAVDGDEFTVMRRTTRHASEHRVQCSARGIDVSNEGPVNAEIRKALHMDAEAFLHSVLLPQGKHAELLTKNPSEKNKILRELFRLDDLDKVMDRVRRQELRATTTLDSLQQQRRVFAENPAEAVADAEAALELAAQFLKRATEAADAVSRMDAEIATCRERAREGKDLCTVLAPAEGTLKELRGVDEVARQQEPIAMEAQRKHDSALDLKSQAEAEKETLRKQARDSNTLRAVEATIGELLRERQRLAEERKLLDDLATQCEAEGKSLGAVREKIEAARKERNLIAGAIAAVQKDIGKLAEMHEKLNTAINARETANKARESAQRALDGRNESLSDLTRSLDSGNRELEVARAAFDAAELDLQSATLENQVAKISEHLHAGDNCPVCHRSLPKGFAPARSADLTKAQKKLVNLKEKFDAARTKASRLEGQIDTTRTNVAEAKDGVETAEIAVEMAGSTLRKLLQHTDDEPVKILSAYRKGVETGEERLRTLQEQLTEAAAALSTLERDETRAATKLDDLCHQRNVHGKVVEGSRGKCKTLSARLPKAFSPKEGQNAATAMLVVVKEAIDVASAVEAKVQTVTNAFALASQDLRTAEEALSRLVREPRGRLFQQLAGIAEATKSAALPRDESKRSEWSEDLVKLAVSKRKRAESELATIEERFKKLSDDRAAVVTEIGGEPQGMVQLLAVKKNDAEHGLAAAHQNAATAKGLDEKAEQIKAIRMGLSGVKEALGARGFPAYATQQRQQRLIQEATLVLKDMTKGRYEFTGEFDILDNESNESRSSQSLSGGEKFLASLALSLAVVEIASNSGSKIESVFLDEGFDGLDSRRLELAMLELRRRARAGRMICVISHVSEVTQFVNDTIVVTRTEDGSDFVRTGAADEDDAVAQGLVSHLAAGVTSV